MISGLEEDEQAWLHTTMPSLCPRAPRQISAIAQMVLRVDRQLRLRSVDVALDIDGSGVRTPGKGCREQLCWSIQASLRP